MLERLSPGWRNLALALIAAALAAFAWSVRSVLNPLILAYLLAFVLHPAVLRLERRGWSRRGAVNAIFVGSGVLFVAMGGLVFLQGRSLVRDLTRGDGVIESIERGVEQGIGHVGSWIDAAGRLFEEEPGGSGGAPEGAPEALPEGAPDGSPAGVPEGGPAAPSEASAGGEPSASQGELRALLSELVDEGREWLAGEGHLAEAGEAGIRAAGGIGSVFGRVFGSIFSFLTLMFLLPIYTYFLLFELERIHEFVRTYLPRRDRARLVDIGGQVGEVLANFFRGRLFVCFLKGVILALGLWLADVPYSFLLGMGAGFLSLIPFFGAFLAFVVAFLLGLIEHDPLGSLLRNGLVFGLAELIEGYVLVPKVLGDSLGLNPLVVLASVMIGAAALGMFGALIALPVTAALVILVRELVLPALRGFAEEEPGEPAPAGPATDPPGAPEAGE